jgi:uncharacterized BrkB/YihY/UPF0761 family membrane protein
MPAESSRARFVIENPLRFVRMTIAGFRANQGLLLAGAVAYYTLLSILPTLALILIVLSQLSDLQLLLDTTREYLDLIAPGHADDLTAQVATFLNNWKLVGVVGILMLVLFSSLAFTTLENAMSVIFLHRVAIRRRHFLISAIIPYCYILCLALGLFLVSTVSGVLATLDERTFTVLGHVMSGVVFLDPIDRQYRLRHVRHGGHRPAQPGGRRVHPAVRRPGNFRIRAHRRPQRRARRAAHVIPAAARMDAPAARA